MNSANSASAGRGVGSPLQLAERFPNPLEVIVFPLYQRPMFPGMMASLMLQGQQMPSALEELKKNRHGLAAFVLTKKTEIRETLGLDDFHVVGVLGKILRVTPVEEYSFQILLRFESRLRLERFVKSKPYMVARVRYFSRSEEGESSDSKDLELETKGYLASLMGKAREIISLNSIFAEEMKIFLGRSVAASPSLFINQIPGHLMNISREELQALLELRNFKDRLIRTLHYMHKEVEVLRVQHEISESVEKKVSADQRKFFLQEQLRYIKKELGLERDEQAVMREKMQRRMQELKLSEEAKKLLENEIEKLSLYSAQSSEYAVAKNYIDIILSLPWGIERREEGFGTKSLAVLRRSLEANHYGMDEAKERVLEFLAVQRLTGKTSGSILCLLGAPGVGKTSLAKSIAFASGRDFFRFSLGGMRDEAEIKGHRRTYVGALPGKIIQALRNKQSMNLLITLDEIDKMAMSYQGDPASALLEVLDPEQNIHFRDHYLDLDFDLSKIFFITTANTLHGIPRPLLDRMEIIEVSGYTTFEKEKIARRHLLPKLEKQHGLSKGSLIVEAAALKAIIHGYARESGLRSLEKALAKICRKLAMRLAFSGEETQAQMQKHRQKDMQKQKRKQTKQLSKKHGKLRIQEKDLFEYLGKTIFREEEEISDAIGVVCGLAWTEIGGSTLYIEAMSLSNDFSFSKSSADDEAGEQEKAKKPRKIMEASRNRGFRLTGNVGKVMSESAEIALSVARVSIKKIEQRQGLSSAKRKNMKATLLEEEIHLHVPAGAVPKDGPSAGAAMACALLSLALGEKLPRRMAMTGELSLSGLILPVGGIREKLIAAARAGKKIVYLPKANKADYDELPVSVRKSLKVFFVQSLEELLGSLFPFLKGKGK